MLKRVICTLLIATIILVLPINTRATPAVDTTSIMYLDDGSYITITIDETGSRASGTKSGRKTYTYTASNGDICWESTLTGTFTYTGTTATCTASNCSVTVYESNWYTVSKSASKSGNTATATFTMGRKVLGITIAKDTYEITLSCDKDGNLS